MNPSSLQVFWPGHRMLGWIGSALGNNHSGATCGLVLDGLEGFFGVVEGEDLDPGLDAYFASEL